VRGWGVRVIETQVNDEQDEDEDVNDDDDDVDVSSSIMKLSDAI